MYNELKAMNSNYDVQSSHSLNKEGQQKWNKYIAYQLKDLEQYAVDCKQSSL